MGTARETMQCTDCESGVSMAVLCSPGTRMAMGMHVNMAMTFSIVGVLVNMHMVLESLVQSPQSQAN
ncbi:MAG: hypothetical protein JWM16_1456 [Verrucomicrobiales bacterium]|nr:hypothetical protein [Verrucomicrobiales bacterium]